MSRTSLRRAAIAGVTTLALMGAGMGAAIAATTTTTNFSGSFYIADGQTLAAIAPGTSIGWDTPVNGEVTPGDLAAGTFTFFPEGAAGTTGIYGFISLPGQENSPAQWEAFESFGTPAGGALMPPVTPGSFGNGDAGAVKTNGGDYSLGFAYTYAGGAVVSADGLFFVRIHVTAGTGAYTYETVSEDVVKTETTTTITTAPATVDSGDAFSLSATVSPAPTDGGTVTFKDGGNTIGTATVTGGVATLAGASLLNAGTSDRTAAVTAVYAGDAAFNGSTSAAVSFVVHPGDITTTTTVTATSVSGQENRPVKLVADVDNVVSAGAGKVTFSGSLDGAAAEVIAGPLPVDAAGHLETSISSLTAGVWTISAAFTGTAPYLDSASTTSASLTLVAAPEPVDHRSDDQYLDVTIPEGILSITTPWTSAEPLDLKTAHLDDATSTFYVDPTEFGSATNQAQAIQIIDRRAGVVGFTAQVKSSDFTSSDDSFPASHLGLINLDAHQVGSGVNENTLKAGDVDLTDIPANTPGLSSTTAQTFAKFVRADSTDPEHATGTAWISGDVELSKIPSSVQPGLYHATLTFTVL